MNDRANMLTAIEEGRRFVGVELKGSYFEQACRNLAGVRRLQGDLFAERAAELL